MYVIIFNKQDYSDEYMGSLWKETQVNDQTILLVIGRQYLLNTTFIVSVDQIWCTEDYQTETIALASLLF